MYNYYGEEDTLSRSEEGLFSEQKRKLEIELVKLALNSLAREWFFETEDVLTEKHLGWTLKQLFSFDIHVTKIAPGSFTLRMQDGAEWRLLDFSITPSSSVEV
jgi:hypothetical protein